MENATKRVTVEAGRQLTDALANACPAWARGTLVLFGEANEVVGYGQILREGETLTLVLGAAPQGVSLLGPPQRP